MTTNDLVQPVSEREEALLSLKRRRALQGHLVAYLVIVAAVWVIWAITSTGYPWPIWPTGGWGLVLVLHAWDVHLRRPITETDLEREIKRLHPSH